MNRRHDPEDFFQSILDKCDAALSEPDEYGFEPPGTHDLAWHVIGRLHEAADQFPHEWGVFTQGAFPKAGCVRCGASRGAFGIMPCTAAWV